MKRFVLYGIFIWSLAACHSNDAGKDRQAADSAYAAPAMINYSAIDSFPHDTTSFTEGLLVHDGQLFESTGHTETYASSKSWFGMVDKKTGKIIVKASLDPQKYFGEGIVFLKNRIYQLTYSTQVAFIYDAATYRLLDTVHYSGEGWGLTTNGAQLLMSNGSSNVVYRDPASFTVVKTLNVTDNNGPVSDVNELELINGFLYANQWLTPYILKIDTATGKVLGKLDLSELAARVKKTYPGSAEMNGIAFDSADNKIYVTGKLWPMIYQLKLDH